MSPQVALIEFFIVIYVFITLFVLLVRPLVLLVFNVLLVCNALLVYLALFALFPPSQLLLSSLYFLFSGAMHESSLFQLFK